MQEKLVSRAKELLSDGTVVRVLGWRKGDTDFSAEPAFFESASPSASYSLAAFSTLRNASRNCSSDTSSPLIWNRSLMRTRCGEVKSPVFLPPASSIAFKYAQTLPFPFVPATWIILIPSCGFPRRERSSLVCSGGCFTVNFGIVSI